VLLLFESLRDKKHRILQYLQEGPWLTHFQYVPQFFGVWWWKSVYLSVEDLTCDSFMAKVDVEVDGALDSPRKNLRFTQCKCGCHSVTGFFFPSTSSGGLMGGNDVTI
jgi:hypothetical protein